MDSKRIPKSTPQTHRQPDQPAPKRLPLPGNQESLMRLQGMIGNQAVQRLMIQRQIEMEEMEIPVEEDSSSPMVLDEMEVPVEGGGGPIEMDEIEVPVEGEADDSGAITRPDGVVEFPPDHVPSSGGVGPTVQPDNLATPRGSADGEQDASGGWMKDMIPFW